MTRRTTFDNTMNILTIIAGLLCLSQLAHAQDAISAPAQKQIDTTKTQIVPSLIVMNAQGASLQGDTLTLNGPGIEFDYLRGSSSAFRKTCAYHSSSGGMGLRPRRQLCQRSPERHRVGVQQDGSKVRDAVVVLKSPKLEGDRLTFAVQVLEGDLAGADGPASVFIDIIGLPRTPLSFAGVARRTAYRGAWYGAAAAGAAVAGAAAYGAAAAAPYYYARPTCGYYPHPPCY